MLARAGTSPRWRSSSSVGADAAALGAQYGGLKADYVKRLKELQRENGKLKRMVADQLLEIDALREVAKGNW